jgi:catalase-peroxidase
MQHQSTGIEVPVSGDMLKHTTTGAIGNRDWWPNQLNLGILHHHSELSNPLRAEFNYAEEFKSLDLYSVVKDLHILMTDSQDWWPSGMRKYGDKSWPTAASIAAWVKYFSMPY